MCNIAAIAHYFYLSVLQFQLLAHQLQSENIKDLCNILEGIAVDKGECLHCETSSQLKNAK